MPIGEQQVCYRARREGHHLFVYENSRTLTFPIEIVGKSETVTEFREGHLSNQHVE